MIGLVAAQDVVEKVGAEGHLAAGFFLAGMTALNQARDNTDVAEGAFE